MTDRVSHEFEPIFDENSRVLILGTFPSVKSRENNFYYGHPQNRFWKVTAALCASAVPVTVAEKKEMLLKGQIAIWDVISSCSIEGSSDSSIKNVVPNDLETILSTAGISQIFCNGGTSHQYYRKYQEKSTGRTAIRIPSTSPANAAWSVERLKKEWCVIRTYLENPSGRNA